MKTGIVWLSFLISMVANYASAQPTSLYHRPLRSLTIGSTILVSATSGITEATIGKHFQNGIGVPASDLDLHKPYCRIDELSSFPACLKSEEPFTLSEIEGGYYADKEKSEEPAFFRTKLTFQHQSGHSLIISCSSPSQATLNETTLQNFDEMFEGHLRFGKIELNDTCIYSRHVFDPENLVLGPTLLWNRLILEVQQDLVLRKQPGAVDEHLNWYIQDGEESSSAPGDTPYCNLVHIQSNGPEQSSNLKEIKLAKGTRLKFNGGLSAGYVSAHFLEKMGFYMVADIGGADQTLKLFCKNMNYSRALTYSEARRITKGYLDWIVSLN